MDYGDIEDDTDVHPRHHHNSDESDTALLADQLTSANNNGMQNNNDQNEHSDSDSHRDTERGGESSSNTQKRRSNKNLKKPDTISDSESSVNNDTDRIEMDRDAPSSSRNNQDDEYLQLPKFKKRAIAQKQL